MNFFWLLNITIKMLTTKGLKTRAIEAKSYAF